MLTCRPRLTLPAPAPQLSTGADSIHIFATARAQLSLARCAGTVMVDSNARKVDGVETAAVLLITADTALSGPACAAGAAAGRAVTQLKVPVERARWRRADLVLIDSRELTHIRRAVDCGELPRRAGLAVVHTGEPGAQCWADCLALGIAQLIELPAQADRLVALLGRQATSGSGRCLAVLGSSGGIGASVLAAATAVICATNGESTLLADVDAVGAGLDVTIGADGIRGSRWQQLRAQTGWLPADAVRQALPKLAVAGSAVLLACPDHSGPEIDPQTVAVVIDSLLRAGYTVVADLGRYPDPAGQTVLDRADAAVLLVGAWIRSFAGADRQWERCRQAGVRSGLLVRGPSPGGLTARHIASALDGTLLGAMRPEPGLDRQLEDGRLPGQRSHTPLGRAAQDIYRWLKQ